MYKESPFHIRTAELCLARSWQEWSGYFSAPAYGLDHSHEYIAVRTSCALFDVSPLYKYHIHGPDAERLLNRVVTRDVSRCPVGRVQYSLWCDDDGKVIDDGTLAHLDKNSYRMTAADPTMYWLQDNAFGMDVTIDDVTDEMGALALQGPTSRAVLKQLTSADLDTLRYFGLLHTELAGVEVTITRTGYTGDLGYELWIGREHAEPVWDALLLAGEAYRLRPAGLLALDMARIEAGLLLIDVDFHSSNKVMYEIQKSSPFELSLDWTVALEKEFFVGQSALQAEKRHGIACSTVGLEVDLNGLETLFSEFGMPLTLPYQAWNDAIPVYGPDGQIGKATSGTWSPILKKYIVLARVPQKYARPGVRVGLEVTIEGHRKPINAEVVQTPFFNPPRKMA